MTDVPHPESTPQPEGPRTVLDERYAFRGTYDTEPEGLCRVRILAHRGQPPVMVITELIDNPSTSVTNLVEILAAELIARHLPHRFEVVGEDPVTLIEHYEPMRSARTGRRGHPTYDRVTFQSWAPRAIWFGGQQRLALAEPDWRHLPDHEVRQFLGEEADDLPQAPLPPDGHLDADYDERQGGYEED